MTPPRFKVERLGRATMVYGSGCRFGQMVPVELADELNRLYEAEDEHERTKQELFVLQNNYQDLEIELGGAIDDNAKGFRAIILCDTLHEGWDTEWDYGLSPDELGDRKRDGHRVQFFNLYSDEWLDSSFTERELRCRDTASAARMYRASKQPSPPPAPATENVPLHKVIGRTLPGGGAPILDIMWRDAEHTWKWVGCTTSWHPLPINDDGTVTVLIDAPAATSDKGAS